MTIAIFGVTADPFTVAHRAIVEEIINKKVADKVIIVPSFVTWHRSDKSGWLTCDERISSIYALMNQSTLPTEAWKVDTIEFDRLRRCDGPLRDVLLKRRRFIDTLCDMCNTERRCSEITHDVTKLKVVIGADEFNIFKQWACWEDIIKLAKLVVVLRGDIVLDPAVIDDVDYEVIKLDPSYNDVSATKIREKYKGRFYDEYIADTLWKDRLLQHTPIFDLVESHIKDLGFNPVKVVSNDWVTVLAKRGDKFITVRQLRYGLMKEFIEFPCGTTERGEPASLAAPRELAEETGINLGLSYSDMIYLGKVPTNPAFMTNFMHYFFVDLDEVEHTVGKQWLDEHEKIVVEEHSIDDLFSRAYNTAYDSDQMMPALMCTALFLYDHYRKYPSHYKTVNQYTLSHQETK